MVANLCAKRVAVHRQQQAQQQALQTAQRRTSGVSEEILLRMDTPGLASASAAEGPGAQQVCLG